MTESTLDHEELIKFCAVNNPDDFNKDKALEEALEFSEAIIKRKTKHKDNPKRPDKKELIKEYGDLTYRGMIYLAQEFPELTLDQIADQVDEHIDEKLNKLHEYRAQGKYKLGL